MTGAVFFETLRRSWKQIFYWGIGIALYAIYPFVLMPDSEGMEQYVDMVDSLDAGMLRAFGIESGAMIGTPEGFVGYSFFGFLLLITSIFAVIAGLNVTANEEDAGIMDIAMSLPLQRWQYVIEKLTAYMVMFLGICALAFGGILLGDGLATMEIDVSISRYLEGMLNLIPGTLLIMAFTAFVSVIVRRKIVATAIAGIFVVVSYLVDTIGRVADTDTADAIREISVFSHYDGTSILTNGLAIGSFVAILLVTAALWVGTVIGFERRDIAA